MRTPFAVLAVPETADDATVKKAYLRMVRAHPPERDAKRFQEARDAYERIKTERLRLAYRLFHHEPPDAMEVMEYALVRGDARRPDVALLRRTLAHTVLKSMR